MKKFAVASIAALSLIGVGSACAGGSGVPTTVVKYGDLDLTNVDGAATLYRRINQAAHAVCRDLDPREHAFSDLKPTLEVYQGCLNQAIIGAVAKINRASFSNYVAKEMTLPSRLTYLQLASK